MTTYTEIPNSAIDPESPVDTSLMFSLRDNPIAISEGAIGAPKYVSGTLIVGAITTDKLNFNFPISEVYTSPEIGIGYGAIAVIPITNGRGVPKYVQCHLVCKTAELGYSVGDRLLVEPISNYGIKTLGGGFTGGMTIRFISSGTSARIRMQNSASIGGVFGIVRADNGFSNFASNTFWKLVVKFFW